MKEFTHTLATRVGIGIYDEAWFDYRLRLFEAIVVPSIAAQTSQDFTWLLVVDRHMPPTARSRFDQAIAGLANAAVLPVEFKVDFQPTVVEWSLARAVEVGADYIMSSRLDDDDALRVDAFERLQSEAADFLAAGRRRYAVFSLNIGCMWLPSRRQGYTRYHDSHSLGLSLVLPAGERMCVYSRPHREIKQQLAPRGAYIRGIDGDGRWWLYATHQLCDSETGNRERIDKVLNHKYGYRVDDAMLHSFGLDPEVIDQLTVLAEPESREPTKFLSLRGRDAEKEIKELRSRLRSSPRRQVWRRFITRWRLRRLEHHRRAAGSDIVQKGPPVTGLGADPARTIALQGARRR